MAFYNNQPLTLDRGFRRSPRRQFTAVGQRLASTFRGTKDAGSGDDQDTLTDLLPLRFTVVRRGYDCEAVDEYVSQLETELAALDQELTGLRGGTATAAEVEIEIKRIGEQTSAVLMAAHEQREEILRQARAEAERCVADASTKATALTAQCEQRLRDLGAQTRAAQAQRDRLLDELRAISAGLAAVVDSAQEHPAAQT